MARRRPMRGLKYTLAATALAASVAPSPVPRRGQAEVLAAGHAPPAASGVSAVQIIAHPDDDLLFMSPDLANDVRAGASVATIVLTAGEGHAGMGADRTAPRAYAAERRAGLRSAYAHMARATDTWRTETVSAGPARVTIDTLAERPRVRLVFLALPDGRDPRAPLGRHTLTQVERGTAGCAAPLWTSGFCYSRASILETLSALLCRFRPTVVRTQDPQPDARYSADHADHGAAARLADAAVRRYGPVPQVHYRDYNIRDVPVNLAPEDRRRKAEAFTVYARHDHRINPEATRWRRYERRMRYRWPRGTAWAGAGPDGRLYAFSVVAGRLWMWAQSADGSMAGPYRLGDGGAPLAPRVAVSGGRVFALRPRRNEIVAARPTWDGRRWTTSWQRLGGPGGRIGAPAAATDGTGRTMVFARDGLGTVSVRAADAGGWSRLPAPPYEANPPGHDVHDVHDIQDDVAATVSEGRIELYGATRDQISRWAQSSTGFRLGGTLPGARPAGPLTAVAEPDGTRVLYDGGQGVVRATTAAGDTMPTRVFATTGEAPAEAALPEPDVPVLGAPAIATDGARRTVALVFGEDGRLYTSTRAGSAFGPWHPAGR